MLINREFLPNIANINKRNSSKDAPLHVACSKGQFKVVEYLVNGNAKVNIKGHKDYTPLHVAVSKGHTSIVKLLIARGSNVNQSAKDHWKPIHIAATLDKLGKKEEAKQELLRNNTLDKVFPDKAEAEELFNRLK